MSPLRRYLYWNLIGLAAFGVIVCAGGALFSLVGVFFYRNAWAAFGFLGLPGSVGCLYATYWLLGKVMK